MVFIHVMAKHICITGPFEGCGATAAAVNLAAGIAVLEHKCLLVDFDPAFSAICAARPSPFPYAYMPGQVITEPLRLKEALLSTMLEFMYCVPAGIIGVDISKSRVETESDNENISIDDEISGRMELLCADLEFTIWHIPSSSGMVDFTHMPALERLLVPVSYDRLQPDKIDATANQLDLFFTTLFEKNQGEQFQASILVTMTPNGLLETRIQKNTEPVAHGYPVLSPSIPKDEAMRKSALSGESVFIFDISSTGAQACLELAAKLVEAAAISSAERMKKESLSRNGGLVYKKAIIDTRREMIRRLTAGIDIKALKAELIKTAERNCNEPIEFLDGDFVTHDGKPAFRLDFTCNGLWSLIIGTDGEILSIIEKFSSREETPIEGNKGVVREKDKAMAKKLAEIMAEINT
ncbi:MAG: hypothetical protein GXP53_01500 [Deltaproteobacteria bacterium]|nr:hypothetical protein [Deltaproteobacteria bacterium]